MIDEAVEKSRREPGQLVKDAVPAGLEGGVELLVARQKADGKTDPVWFQQLLEAETGHRLERAL